MSLAAIVLAAGMSRRMGQPKMLLPWGQTTVLGQVVSTLASAAAGIDREAEKHRLVEIAIITGGARELVEAEVARLAGNFPVWAIFNEHYAAGEMISSLRVGLAALSPQVAATLIALGDQPQLSLDSARRIVSAWKTSGAGLIIPSFNLRRGHPWLVGRELWAELAAANTARDFLHAQAAKIKYVECDDSVLKDLDTPEDYAQGLKMAG